MGRAPVTLLASLALLLLAACGGEPTPTPTATTTAGASPTPSPTSTPTPAHSDLLAINDLTCVDLYPGIEPPPGSPMHILTASGTVANRDPNPIAVHTLIEVVTLDGTVIGEADGDSLSILGSRPAEPFTLTYDDPPTEAEARCRVHFSAGTDTLVEASAVIEVIFAP